MIALIVFGPGKLPELGASLGRAIREFRKTSSEITSEFTREIEAADRGQQTGSREAKNEEETKAT